MMLRALTPVAQTSSMSCYQGACGLGRNTQKMSHLQCQPEVVKSPGLCGKHLQPFNKLFREVGQT